ncbi:MAG: iron-containing alcohol dehydrogenase [Thiohalomonadaceae bacterium]
MEFPSFAIATLPRLAFGEGRIAELPGFIAEYGRKVLLVTGARAFRATPHWQRLIDALKADGIELESFSVSGEPSPALVDEAVQRFHRSGIEVVVGIGGGSVIDAAKAIAGLLPSGRSVLDFLEDVGRGLPYTGPSTPFIAVPTTAGTGSEATKNAVLSMRGHGGYKKSFRHEQLVARVALVDPALLASCPPQHVAAQGMDAFTQLLESYVSVRANPFTDGLALSGLRAVKQGFMDAWRGGDSAAARNGRAAMAYAAYVSGVTLAQVGLGSVHGLAQPLGAFFPVPHGVACGTTVAAATAANIAALRARDPQGPGLRRYAEVGRLLSDKPCEDDAAACDALVQVLMQWTEQLGLPRLSAYGVSEADLPRIVQASRNNSMKTNPVLLTDEEIAAIVRARL